MASALFGFEGTSLGKPLASARTLKTAQEKEMQDEVAHRRKLCVHFTGILGFKSKKRQKQLTANGEKDGTVKKEIPDKRETE